MFSVKNIMSPLTFLLIFVAVVIFFELFLYRTVLLRILVPWMADRALKKISQSEAKADPRVLENPKYGTLLPGDEHLEIVHKKGDRLDLKWNDVQEIHVYKRDLFSVDLICMAFKLSEDKFIEIHEEIAGYHDLQARLPKIFPGIREDWFTEVAFPAFQANHTVIWRRV